MSARLMQLLGLVSEGLWYLASDLKQVDRGRKQRSPKRHVRLCGEELEPLQLLSGTSLDPNSGSPSDTTLVSPPVAGAGASVQTALISSSSLWASPTPATIDAGDTSAIELGVKFTADTDGFITGLRFYKSAANTGTHVGHLWTNSGQLLATATFTAETASGWQQVNFAAPVAIAAGTTYVASYYAPNGHFSVNRNYFGSSFTSGLLHVPASGGVFKYGATSTFPTQTYQATNYWVDVLFTSFDATPPTVTAFSPAGGSSDVPTGAPFTVTFSEGLDATSVTASTIQLLDGATPVAAGLAYNASDKTVTITPTAALANSKTYAISVLGGAAGVKDAAGNALAQTVTSTFTTIAPLGPSSSLWTTATSPATLDSKDGSAIEVGVKFTADADGFVTGLRFYKSTGNTGTHIGHLWTSTGQLLATATFTGETTSGWQQVTFSNAVAITAGTTYVASYYAPKGHYSVNRSYFATPFTNGLLHVPAGGGVFKYGANGVFPTQTYQASNYWVDVLFSSPAVVDTTPPTVTAFSPAGGATNASTNAPIIVTFNEALDATSVTASTVRLLDGSTPVAAGVAYNASNKTVTITPTAELANSKTYTISVLGGANGVKDVAGNALAQTATSTFTTIMPLSSDSSLWSMATTPSTLDSKDTNATEVGVKFTADADGFITGLRFYKSAANSGTHVGHLWTSAGQLLATATFTGETASGWQQVSFSNPVAITAGTTYVASYYAPKGHFSVNRNYFGSPFTNGLLHAPTNAGVFKYGAASAFPTQTYQSSNYWIDIDFKLPLVPDTTPPSVTALTPVGGSTNVATNAAVAVTFNEAMTASTVNASTVLLMDGASAVTATVSYDAATRTATLTPGAALGNSKTYAVVVKGGASGVEDVAGNAMATDVVSSFTTAAPPNQAPVAVNNSYSTNEDSVLTIAATGVLANDTDAEGDPLTAAVVTGPTHGTLALNADGSFTYSPVLNYNGADSFTYRANDGTSNSNTATVALTVVSVNDPPFAVTNSYSTNEGTVLTVSSASGVLANDSDVDGNPLTAALVTGPTRGALSLNSNGSFTYTPTANYNGPDSFTYRANDGTVDSNTATVLISVNAVNDAPVAVADSYSTTEDNVLTVAASGVLANDTDADGNPLTAALV
ncbi:MAG: DUF4082 domain-containing protein, partial [Planctomycetia bacterium]|nr:DUF4082 domain-containing protein [Planctomycetia bacterium]